MESVADLAPADGGSHLGPSVAHHDLFQAYLGHPGQSAHAHASLESMLGGHALGGAPASGLPLPGTTIDNPLMSFVIGKAENGPGAGQHASELPSAWAPTGTQGPTERSDRTEGAAEFDPRAVAVGLMPASGSQRLGAGTVDFMSGDMLPQYSGRYDDMGLVGAHFPGHAAAAGRGGARGAPAVADDAVFRGERAGPGARGARRARAAGEGRGGRSSGGSPGGSDKGLRSSQFRGVTKHRRSGRFEAHIWVKDLGRQVYLGGYECEEHAAEAYDIAALKCKGRRGCKTNFDVSKYADLLGCINRMTMEELVMAVRRQSQGFSRGTSSFRGVTHHPSGRWEARIGVPGSKHIYLGLFVEEREAARAYDRALVRLRGRSAATNFSLTDYKSEMADYHRMQARLLGADTRFAEISGNPALFERWVKGGCEAFPELGAGSTPSSNTHINHQLEGCSENGVDALLHPVAAESESKTPLNVAYSHASASSGR
ncbi:hypothetical protein QBZ16_004351 [Prototheca wickerhamii]|uniref:AP2/ERF domain-containing protein n=1 Tax=Prototheca wickerhamii TaxID=3111 RepID=A0AAD9MMS9_PROWI|nr:hypothetical protein QBZ16_004351 [Prototheca wickerhamii]